MIKNDLKAGTEPTPETSCVIYIDQIVDNFQNNCDYIVT
jgi:hypothetical protein